MKQNEIQTKEVFFAYLPAMITLLITIVTTILYVTVIEVHYWTVYCSLGIMMVVPFAFIFVNRRFDLGLPRYLIILMCSHAVVSVDMGTAMGFYSRLPWWDATVHCYFGFLAGAIIYCLFAHAKDVPLTFWEHLIIVLLVVAFAALWEVYEFVVGEVLGCDMQDVGLLTSQGLNPLTDTVSDICVATLGAALFQIGYWFKTKIGERKKEKAAAKQALDEN